ETLKKQHLSEFKFLRAFYYWFVVETWGPVILKTEPTNSPVLTATRSSVADFYDLIISDLKYASENAADVEAQPGRVTKKAALGILARAALSGAYQVDAKKDEYLKLAKSTADQLINNASSYGIKLYSNYADVWNEDNNKDNKEALYRVTFSTFDYNNESYGNDWWQLYKFNYNINEKIQMSHEYGYRDKNWGNPNFTYPSKYLFDMYNPAIDSRFENSFRTVWKSNIDDPIDQPATGDTVIYITIGHDPKPSNKDYKYLNIDSIYNSDGTVRSYSNPFPALKKFDSPKYNGYYKKTRYGLEDHFVMRFSEVYLIAAEADFLLGNSQGAADYVNVVRERAAKPGDEEQMKVSASDISIDFLLAERAREFCGEGLRWFDLKRTGKLVDQVRKYNKGPASQNIKDYNIVRPIPSEELDALLNRDEFVKGLTGYNY
ncbi:MAG TPA: RagB/SusD family nutrient uptake outer membrane protein, partial [Sunxiuqinia sp.]|nr:RagB/SusD family nutrient uptake outer membrane protein [Sunxiuqinia sp.]